MALREKRNRSDARAMSPQDVLRCACMVVALAAGRRRMRRARSQRAAHRARRMPAAEGRAGGAMRHARRARGSAPPARAEAVDLRRGPAGEHAVAGSRSAVLLAGGPGQAASTLGPFALQLGAIRRTRDIVLIDQRGTGRSSPLDCPGVRARRARGFDTDPVPKARCAQASSRREASMRRNTRRAPGSPTSTTCATRSATAQFNLWGGSYGTRVAQEYLRRHPERVRSVVLDGVAPPSMRISLDVWRTRDAALDGVIAACGHRRRA